MDEAERICIFREIVAEVIKAASYTSCRKGLCGCSQYRKHCLSEPKCSFKILLGRWRLGIFNCSVGQCFDELLEPGNLQVQFVAIHGRPNQIRPGLPESLVVRWCHNADSLLKCVKKSSKIINLLIS